MSLLQKTNQRILYGLEWIGRSTQRIFTERHYQKPRFWLAVLLGIVLLFLLQHCSKHHAKQARDTSIPVVLAVAKSQTVPVYLSALGAVTPTYSVTIRTQVNGQLVRVLFREGQMVKAGDLLAEIDARPYQAQLMQYEGQLARDKALLANAQLDLKRYQTLWRQDSVAKQTLDTQAALVKQDEGAVKLDEGLVQTAQVNLIYTKIVAPIDGRIGLRLVDPGNFIQTSDTAGIAVINMLNPITVVFTIPEDNVPEVTAQMKAGATLAVEAYNREKTRLLATGKLLTIDNQIDPATGTVKLKAQFSNENNALFPNQFVNVKLLVKQLQNAVVVPTAAIQHGTQNAFVYVANKDNTVSMKTVTTSTAIENETVVTGLSAGQAVVVEGADKLTDGAKISTEIVRNSKKNVN